MNFADALREFLTHPEHGQEVNLDVWDENIPFMGDVAKLRGRYFFREDVFTAFKDDDIKGAVFALVWGYPSGHTNHRNKDLEVNLQNAMKRLEPVAATVNSLRHYGTPDKNPLTKFHDNNPGLKTASTSKIAYFAGLNFRGERCLIFDRQVMRAIHTEFYPELDELRLALTGNATARAYTDREIERGVNAAANYPRYLEGVGQLARNMQDEFEPDDIERFLFELGREIGRSPTSRQWVPLSRSVII